MNASATREQALDLYYYLRLNRSLEELLARLFRQDKIVGGLYGSLRAGSHFGRRGLCAWGRTTGWRR